MTASPRCPRDHLKLGRGILMDRILTDGGGWACPGILLDGSDCGYELGVVRAVPVSEAEGLRALLAEVLDSVEATSDRAGFTRVVAGWRKRAEELRAAS